MGLKSLNAGLVGRDGGALFLELRNQMRPSPPMPPRPASAD